MKKYTELMRMVLAVIAMLCLSAPGLAQAPAAGNQTMHILVGRSVLINSQVRFTRVVVGSDAAIETLVSTPTQIVVTAKAPGSSSLVLWDETGRTRVMEVFCDVDVSALRDAIQQSFPSEQVQVEGQEGKVVLGGVVATQPTIDQILKMALNYSKDVVNSMTLGPAPRQKQIMLKVRFAEVDRSKLSAMGINIFSTGGANTIGTIGTQQFGSLSLGTQGGVTGTIGAQNTGTATTLSVSDLLNVFIFRPDLNLGATIKDLQQKNVLQILAEPNLLAMNGQPAKFLAGGEFPYPIVNTSGGLSTVTIQFRPFGVKLEFTATIEKDDVVRLKVVPEVSTLDYANAISLSGFVLPAISTRRAETEVELKNGQSFGIAGLIDQRTTVQMSKVPGLGDIPILGLLFRSRSVNHSNTELLVLVTPTIVDPLLDTAPPKEPVQPIKSLPASEFDKGLPGNKKDESH